MNTGSFIKQAFPRLIEATEDPTAPIKLQSAHGAASAVGKMLAVKADEQKVREYSEMLMNSWTDEQINKICYEPEFVIALSAMFCESLINYTRKIAGDTSLR